MAREDNKESKGLFGKFFKKLDESLETSRGKTVAETSTPEEKGTKLPSVGVSPSKQLESGTTTYAIRDTKTDKLQKIGVNRMLIPEGVVIEGSIVGECDAQIYGTVNGNITIKGKLELGAPAKVKGTIRAVSSMINGNVEGNVHCDEDVEIGQNSKVVAEITAGQRVIISGVVKGNIKAGALVKLLSTAKVEGDVTVVKNFSIDENAVFNGKCIMGKVEDIKPTGIGNNPAISSGKTPSSGVPGASSQQIKK